MEVHCRCFSLSFLVRWASAESGMPANAVQSRQAMMVLTCISLIPFVDDLVRYLVLDGRVQDFPDVIRLPTAVRNQIAVKVRIVNNVPCLVNGAFKCQHQVQLLVDRKSVV